MEIFEKNYLVDATMENDNDAKFLYIHEKNLNKLSEFKSARDNLGDKMGNKDLWKIKKCFFTVA